MPGRSAHKRSGGALLRYLLVVSLLTGLVVTEIRAIGAQLEVLTQVPAGPQRQYAQDAHATAD